MIEKLKTDLLMDEGFSLHVYKDTLDNLTVGVGHLLENGEDLKEDDDISWEELWEFMRVDMMIAVGACDKLFYKWAYLPEEVQLILANMAFNLGYHRLRGFKKLAAAIFGRDYAKAAIEMKNSRWYGQVGDRSKRLVKRMELMS